MATQNAVRAAHRGDGGDPRNAVQLGGEQRLFSKPTPANQAALIAAVARSRANTGMAAAMRAALERRSR